MEALDLIPVRSKTGISLPWVSLLHELPYSQDSIEEDPLSSGEGAFLGRSVPAVFFEGLAHVDYIVINSVPGSDSLGDIRDGEPGLRHIVSSNEGYV